MSRLTRAIGALLDRLLAIFDRRRGRKRKRVTVRYLMLLCVAFSAAPCIELLLKPLS
jgi:hypothetical protein